MRVVVHLDFDDETREALAQYDAIRYGQPARPRATRKQVLAFINAALENQWLHVADAMQDAAQRAAEE